MESLEMLLIPFVYSFKPLKSMTKREKIYWKTVGSQQCVQCAQQDQEVNAITVIENFYENPTPKRPERGGWREAQWASVFAGETTEQWGNRYACPQCLKGRERKWSYRQTR